MIRSNDPPGSLPAEALDDPFRPPAEPCEVFCIHCGNTYMSDQIVWRQDADGKGFWCCPVAGCDGAGFGFDIHPADGSTWVDDEEEVEYDQTDWEQ
jgi:hypothetical protein